MDFSQIPLKPMQLPDAVGIWPPAPGWWLLLLLLVVLTVMAVLWWRRCKADPRRRCLAALEVVLARYQQHQNPQILLTDCNALLKQSAMTLYSRHEVAGLSGQAWFEFLQQTGPRCDHGQLRNLVEGPYRRDAVISADALIAACRQWIKSAKREIADV
ncbi:DUF4381 domain-containing protein [Pontibacterium sp.]|uniref:DUF4381 domain-containing protein n=1 Tax=Pontibacterium sp. TaxID=2036026 RepID=UPI0035142A49